jgi:DNA mismatch repair protein MutH
MIRPSINEVRDKVCLIMNMPHLVPKTANKGKPGNYLEEIAGIPTSSACLDCSDGEVKVFPIKRNKNGINVPKETIAVTMMNGEDLARDSFTESRVYKKLTNVLYIPYERDGDTITFRKPTIVQMPAVEEQLRKDYDDIRGFLSTNGTLDHSSGVGVYMQTRTKGAGGDAPKTRAFYLKKKFIDDMIDI